MNPAVSLKYRLKMIGVLVLCFAIGYELTNHFPVFTPRLLPLHTIDEFFGFHPWTIWIYTSDYILIFLPALLIRHISEMKCLIRGFFLNFAIHYPLFFFFPTTMIRPELGENNLSNQIMALLRLIDTPVNCFPSQHVSLCFVIASFFWNSKRKASIIFFIWATLISISTLTTKQHYFWDVVGGIGVAWIIYFFLFRKNATLYARST